MTTDYATVSGGTASYIQGSATVPISGSVARTTPTTINATGNWRYASQYRPFSFASLPSRLVWVYVEAPIADAWKYPTLPRSIYRYGVIQTTRLLTPLEVSTFQLISVA